MEGEKGLGRRGGEENWDGDQVGVGGRPGVRMETSVGGRGISGD